MNRATPPRLSVLVPVRDDPDGVARCLRALARQDVSDVETLVGDDGSRAPLAAEVIPPGVDGRVFRMEARGPAAARNRLAREARAEHLVFLDADTEPHDDLLAVIRRVLDQFPDASAFVGSYDDDPAHPGVVSSYRNLLHHHVHQQAGEWISTFWCGCGVIRRDLFLAHGGLDESYAEPSIEDVELGLRLARSGLRTRVVHDLQVRHHKAWTLRGFLATDLFRRGIPWVRLLRRHGAIPAELNLGWRHRLSALCVVALAVSLASASAAGAATAATAFTALNLDLFACITRARGTLHGLGAWPLHVLHTAVSIASVPLGLWPSGRGERR